MAQTTAPAPATQPRLRSMIYRALGRSENDIVLAALRSDFAKQLKQETKVLGHAPPKNILHYAAKKQEILLIQDVWTRYPQPLYLSWLEECHPVIGYPLDVAISEKWFEGIVALRRHRAPLGGLATGKDRNNLLQTLELSTEHADILEKLLELPDAEDLFNEEISYPFISALVNENYSKARRLLDKGLQWVKNRRRNISMMGGFITSRLLSWGKTDANGIAFVQYALSKDVGPEPNQLEQKGGRWLEVAVDNCNTDLVELLLSLKARPRYQESGSMTPHLTNSLIRAAIAGDLSMVRLLINHQADVNGMDDTGMTPLLHAVKKQDIYLVRLLLAKHARVDLCSASKANALSQAIDVGRLDLIRLLLDYEADINLIDREGRTPLLQAMHVKEQRSTLIGNPSSQNESPASREAIVKTLLSYHELDVNLANRQGITPLIEAVSIDSVEIVQALLNRGASTTSKDHSGRSFWSILAKIWKPTNTQVLSKLIEHESEIFLQNNTRKPEETPLFFAVDSANSQMVRLLLEKSDDLDNFESTLQPALLAACKAGSIDILQQLVAAGASIHEETYGCFSTPLKMAVDGRAVGVIEQLLRMGARMNHSALMLLSDETNSTLELAAQSHRLPVVKFLIERHFGQAQIPRVLGAALTGLSSKGPLSSDCQNVVEYLLQSGADPNSDMPDGRPVLHQAIFHSLGRSPDLVLALIEAGSDVNRVSPNGDRALDLCSRPPNLNIRLVQLLTAHGAMLSDKFLDRRRQEENKARIEEQKRTDELELARSRKERNSDEQFIETQLGTMKVTALQKAVLLGDVPYAEELLEGSLGCCRDVNNETVLEGVPLLQYAALSNNRPMVELLLSKGADIHARCEGMTAFTLALAKQHHEIIDALLSHKRFPRSSTPALDPDALVGLDGKPLDPSEEGRACEDVRNALTPLMFSALAGSEECTSILLQHGAKKNACNSARQTTLFQVTARKSPNMMNIVSILASANADLDIYDRASGTSVMFTAISQRNALLLFTLLKSNEWSPHRSCETFCHRLPMDFAQSIRFYDGMTILEAAEEKDYHLYWRYDRVIRS